jgi:hypothetical protein
MVFPLIHPKRWFLSPITPTPTRPLPPLKPFTPNHKPGTLPKYLRHMKGEKTLIQKLQQVITITL